MPLERSFTRPVHHCFLDACFHGERTHCGDGGSLLRQGGHNCLMVGPPGSGKSMLASRLPSILPPLSAAELDLPRNFSSDCDWRLCGFGCR
nr:ATP-binding protein [Rhizobium ecuadorense]